MKKFYNLWAGFVITHATNCVMEPTQTHPSIILILPEFFHTFVSKNDRVHFARKVSVPDFRTVNVVTYILCLCWQDPFHEPDDINVNY